VAAVPKSAGDGDEDATAVKLLLQVVNGNDREYDTAVKLFVVVAVRRYLTLKAWQQRRGEATALEEFIG
jgi:hypothetical protein